MLGKRPRLKLRYLPLRNQLRQRSNHHLLPRRLAENRPGNPHIFFIYKSSVKDAAVLPIADDLEHVTDVDDDGIRDEGSCDPAGVVLEDLEAWDPVVEDEGEGANVGVSFDAEDQLRLWAAWVVVDLELEEEVVSAAELGFELVYVKAETKGEDGEHFRGEDSKFLGKRGRGCTSGGHMKKLTKLDKSKMND